ncbi:MAG: hypothetical protein Q9201_006419 [Fulgogasparrea decipioides]
MTSRKRGRAEMESLEPSPETSLLQRLRNTWEFSNLMQFIFIFGKAVKIDEDFTIEYVAKAPERNPFGTEEVPRKFVDFDVFTKLSVLCQLSRWTFVNADRMREKMSETKGDEQVQWRIEEIGYDKQERYYYVLDDNRLYRRTEPPPAPPAAPKPKANSRKAKAAARANKRRKTHESQPTEQEEEQEATVEDGVNGTMEEAGFGGRKWECLAVTLNDYNDFLESIKKSRDADEKALYKRISEDVLPIIEKEEESKQRRQARKERELMNMEKLAGAKRSSRLASKFETERIQREAVEAERKRKADIAAALAHEDKQKKMEEARESRMMTREQRLKEREHKRVLQEEELATLSEDSKKLDAGEARMSERQLKSEMEKRKKELAALAEEDTWTFDCAKCGVHGENLDDGTHSVACEKCNVWQHSACLGISQTEAEKDDFHFICRDCKRRAEDAARPKIPPLRFHLGSSSSPPSQKSQHAANESKKRKSVADGGQMPPLKKFKPVEIHAPAAAPYQQGHPPSHQNGMHQTFMNGPTLSPQGQMQYQQGAHATQAVPPPGLRSPPAPPAYANGYTHHVAPGDDHASQTTATGYQPSSQSVNGIGQVNGHTGTRHAFHQTPQRPYYQSQSAQNPYLNTFDRQRPSSSHATNNVPSPVKKTPVASSPSLNHENTPKLSPCTNGKMPSPSNLPAALPPPVKQQTSSPPPPLHPPSSSPINGPSFQNDAPSSPGFSPTKQSPPRPPMGLDLGNAPVLPPVADLVPSSKEQELYPPFNPLNLEQQAPAVNGYPSRQ